MTFNKYQCPSSCIDCKKVDLISDQQNVRSPYVQQIFNQRFFKCFCHTICSTERVLDMRGNVVYEKIGRCLQDIDIPALLIFLGKNQDITRLNLASNSIMDPGFINLIDHFMLHKNIQELDIGNNNIADIGIRYMMKVGNNLELRNLNLRANKFGDQASKNVALFLLKNAHMQSLNVADVNQTASGLIYFVMTLSSDQLLSNRTLKRLDISRPNPGFMHYFDSAHFADVIGHMLKHNTTLAALHLQKYNFSCHDIESMMRNAKYNNWLHLLDLGCNNIGDHGIDHICAWLIKRPALKTLILHRNIITDHGARSLSFAIPSSKLLTLDISYNKITDDGMVNILYTLKKSPLLRQLRIFGNSIGHPAAKIVKRMLISQVLDQENIDVRPYIVDNRWYFAKYEGDRCKNEYWNIPYKLFMKPKEIPLPSRRKITKYYKYTYSRTTDIKLQHSAISLISNIISSHQVVECRCCYCLKSEECRNADHPDTCNCCKCKGDESSDWSIDKSVLKQVAFLHQDNRKKNIKYILKRVNSTTRENILRWISIDKDILEEDLKLIDDPNASEESTGTTVSCKCSYVQMSIPTLQEYLQESSLKNLLIIPRDNSICLNNNCQDIDKETSSSDCYIDNSYICFFWFFASSLLLLTLRRPSISVALPSFSLICIFSGDSWSGSVSRDTLLLLRESSESSVSGMEFAALCA